MDRTAIEEANKHLLAQSQKIEKLENEINQLNLKCSKQEEEHKLQIGAIIHEKEKEIAKKQMWFNSTQIEMRRLTNELFRKENEIKELRLRNVTLNNIIELKPEIIKLLKYMNEDSATYEKPLLLENNRNAKQIIRVDENNDASNGKNCDDVVNTEIKLNGNDEKQIQTSSGKLQFDESISSIDQKSDSLQEINVTKHVKSDDKKERLVPGVAKRTISKEIQDATEPLDNLETTL